VAAAVFENPSGFRRTKYRSCGLADSRVGWY